MFVMYADKNRLTVRQREPVTSGSVNAYEARFEFSPDWDGMDRAAVFKAGKGSRSILLGESGECTVPWEVMGEPGVFLMAGVCGTQGGAVVLPTAWASLGTILEGVTTGEDAQPPTPNLWWQELASKSDALNYDGEILSLLSGGKPLSTVQIVGGGAPVPGPPGKSGKDGATFTPSVSEDWVLSWTNDGGLENPEPADIKGPQGERGMQGEPGSPGVTVEQVKEAIQSAISGKQDKLTGLPGQVVGFDGMGLAYAVRGWSNQNLMDNWYFADPINQREKTEYTVAGYTIDRYFQGTDITTTIYDGYMSIYISPSGSACSPAWRACRRWSSPPWTTHGRFGTSSLLSDGNCPGALRQIRGRDKHEFHHDRYGVLCPGIEHREEL